MATGGGFRTICSKVGCDERQGICRDCDYCRTHCTCDWDQEPIPYGEESYPR